MRTEASACERRKLMMNQGRYITNECVCDDEYSRKIYNKYISVWGWIIMHVTCASF